MMVRDIKLRTSSSKNIYLTRDFKTLGKVLISVFA